MLALELGKTLGLGCASGKKASSTVKHLVSNTEDRRCLMHHIMILCIQNSVRRVASIIFYFEDKILIFTGPTQFFFLHGLGLKTVLMLGKGM